MSTCNISNEKVVLLKKKKIFREPTKIKLTKMKAKYYRMITQPLKLHRHYSNSKRTISCK